MKTLEILTKVDYKKSLQFQDFLHDDIDIEIDSMAIQRF